LQEISFHDRNEEILGEILGVMRRIASAKNEGKNWAPIDLAKLGQAGINLAWCAGRAALPNQAPARRGKAGKSPGTFNSGWSSHAASVNAGLVLLKDKIPAIPGVNPS
jgi:hypothetical protein